jgi:uncharacterized protein (DUF2236 family)
VIGTLDRDDRERYWAEYRRVGELLGLPPDSMPAGVADLRDYVEGRLADGSLWINEDRRERAKKMLLEPPFTGFTRVAVTPLHETIKLISVGMLPPQIRKLLGFSWDPARPALLRSYLLHLRLGSRFWPDAVRLHPAARGEAGEEYGALAA